MTFSDDISANIKSVMDRVRTAAEKSGRTLDDITVIAVSKTVEVDRINKARELGILNFGENKVQELLNKFEAAAPGLKWHMIGHLQTNKVKYIVDKVELIHSVDSIRLAREIDRQAGNNGKKVNVLVQVNVAGEETKFGISAREARQFISAISLLKNIKVRGLMTIAPYADNSDDIRWVFRELRKLFIDISMENIDNISMDYLSMGMSNDFEVAIEEGSNMVRIGTAIFGPRNY
ncbi:MAG TPA: YggS family pyridoxal phosphate-dependent enzyme [Clostridiaceae bacterium]|jgi:pyridoxal phosphate enzyme (YggS family)|nr:YggS family pyridoxal phosphate-dependent enzyme [Clostridiaceae bacterium]